MRYNYCVGSLINVLHSHLELCSNNYCLAYLLPLSFLLVLCIIHNCYYYHDVHYNLFDPCVLASVSVKYILYRMFHMHMLITFAQYSPWTVLCKCN